MTQADFHRDSASTDVGRSAALPPVPPRVTNDPAPPAAPAPQPAPAAQPPPPASTSQANASQGGAPQAGAPQSSGPPKRVNPPPAVPVARASTPSRPAVVPPPPPARATLPPLRVAPEAAVPNGVGSAKGVRWRGEVDGLARPTASSRDPLAAPQSVPAEDEPDRSESDRVARTAPPWLISLVIHLVLLLALALITTPAGQGLKSLVLTIGQSERQTPVELTEFEITNDELVVDSESIVDSEFTVEMPAIFDAAEIPEASEMTAVELGDGPATADFARPMFNGRTGAMKQALLAMYGGTRVTQESVERGLQWLKRNQRKNGSWSMQGPYRDGGHSENETAATAMALLAFLGDGHTHRGGEYGDVVDKGIKFLIKQQDRSGFFARDARDHERMYAQAQATIAICELYGMTKDSWLRPYAQSAIDFAQKAQSPEGGWRYQPQQDSDTSMTGWFVMALESGRSAGLEVNGAVLHNVGYFLETVADYDGAAYAYQARGIPTPPMTAEGLLCRQYLGWSRDHVPMVRGIEGLLSNSPFDINDRDVYYWYYATQVMHHFGGSPWQQWNGVMREQLPASQVTGGRENGSWAPQSDRWGSSSGRLYTTCLSIYCLEVYYRHMPLYKAGK